MFPGKGIHAFSGKTHACFFRKEKKRSGDTLCPAGFQIGISDPRSILHSIIHRIEVSGKDNLFP